MSIRAKSAKTTSTYVELAALSNYSFLRGGSHSHELVIQASAVGQSGLALCDRNSFAGIVRAHVAMRELEAQFPKKYNPDFRFIVGTRLCFADNTPDILAYPTDRKSYGRLCALLTIGNRRTQKGDCELYFADLAEYSEGQLFAVLADRPESVEQFQILRDLETVARGRVWLAAACSYKGCDRAWLNRLAGMATRARVPLLAINDVLYHVPERRVLQDVLTCIRTHCPIETAGRRLQQNAERHLKSPGEMARLFRDHPEAIVETGRLAARIGFSLDELRYEYPTETIGNGESAQQTLERLTNEGAQKRYPTGVPEKITKAIAHELELIASKDYAPYFLTVHDLVRFAREERGILCQGRGSAANSVVCYCLGVTEVDPMMIDLLFERFISNERNEPPDIDVDFEHERREEVIQYLYNKYGRHRAGLAATVVTYRKRGAVREVGKVFGLSADMIEALNGLNWGFHGRDIDLARVREISLDPEEHNLALVLKLVGELIGFPRHLSQHVGGFVLTRGRLDHLVPISNAAMENRTVVEWDKDDLDALGLLKVDVLGLGMLTCIRRAFEMLRLNYGEKYSMASVPREEPEVYKMTHRADTLGVFQIESRAQMSMLPRLKPVNFYDLVVEVAIVRPGPIQGDMVHPYLRRRNGDEKVEYPKPELKKVLEKTYGVPLFQEQAMKIAIVAAGFTPSEADQLRRAMATFRRTGTIGNFRERLIKGMRTRGYEKDFAERCFKQIEGFADYGFPESHAASFALLVYISCWLKCHYPDVFAAALLNSQPMGFYAPAQIVRDAREHGVQVLDVDINHSDIDTVLEPGSQAAPRVKRRHREMAKDILTTHAIRLGLMRIKGLSRDDAAIIVARRKKGYDSVRDLWLRTGLGMSALEKLAGADAFSSIGLDRRAALWAVHGLKGMSGVETLPLFQAGEQFSVAEKEGANLPPMPPGEQVAHDYRTLSLSLKAHPVWFFRSALSRQRVISSEKLEQSPNNSVVEVAGLVLVRQRPGTASGVIFLTLEDETGVVNIIIWPKVFEKYRRQVLGARFVRVRGHVQKEGLVIHLVAREVVDLSPALSALASGEAVDETLLGGAAERGGNLLPSRAKYRGARGQKPPRSGQHPRNATWPGSRDFH
ncbi:MAG TPA: error-prone DNA polymerase [Devosia sp.]|nr:error-prone DNA polymerase [Devosia sp.]